MQTNHDQYKTGLHDSNSPMNREQLPRNLSLVEQLQIEVDELNGKLREEIELKKYWLKRCNAASVVTKASFIIKQMEAIEAKQGFRITGATLNDGKRYLELKGELFNLIN